MPRATPTAPPTATPTSELLIHHAKNNDVEAVGELLLGEAYSTAETDPVDKGIGSYNHSNHNHNGHQRHHESTNYSTNQFRNGSQQRTGVDDGRVRTGVHVPHVRYDFDERRDDTPLPCRVNVDGYDPHDLAQRTALYYAASRNSLPLCRLLLRCGANPNRPTATNKSTPLHAAADNGHLEVVKLLLER
jgi:hypothetical protein